MSEVKRKISDCNECARSCKKAFYEHMRFNCPYYAKPYNMRVSLLQHTILKNPGVVQELLDKSKLKLMDIKRYPHFELLPQG